MILSFQLQDEELPVLPILTIRLELIENNVSFRPPLDQMSSIVSVQEHVAGWLAGFVARGRLVKMLGAKVKNLRLAHLRTIEICVSGFPHLFSYGFNFDHEELFNCIMDYK